MKGKKRQITFGERIIGLGLFLAIIGLINSIMIYEPGNRVQGFLCWVFIVILLLGIGTYAVLIRLIKDLNNIEGKISGIVDELKKK